MGVASKSKKIKTEATPVVEETSYGITLEPYQVILRPLVTEKNVHKATRLNQYSYEIHAQATKEDVRRAVEELFHVPVKKVCIQNRNGKQRRYKFKTGETKCWKKAVVSLGPDHRIDFF